MTSPPIVSYSPSGARYPVAVATSSMRSRPDTRQPLPAATTSGVGVVVFVTDVADDLLDQVLDGHHARGAAVLVDDHRGLQVVGANLCHQRVAVQRGGHPATGARPSVTGVSARSAGGTPNTCLTCTMPTVSSRSPSTTGNREKPLSAAAPPGRRRCRRLAAQRSSTSESSAPRRSGHRIAATGPAAPRWRGPASRCEPKSRTSDTSSCGERADRSS